MGGHCVMDIVAFNNRHVLLGLEQLLLTNHQPLMSTTKPMMSAPKLAWFQVSFLGGNYFSGDDGE